MIIQHSRMLGLIEGDWDPVLMNISATKVYLKLFKFQFLIVT